jgi:glutathione S-transferase
MRAWLALRAAQFDFDEEIIDIRRPQRFEGLGRIGRLSPSASVPVLITDEAIIFDSLAIMEFANEVASGELLPASIPDRARARSIIAWQHSGLSRICERISFESSFYPLKRRLTSSEIWECNRLFSFLERVCLANEEAFLFGRVSLADFALAPTVIRLSRHHPPMESFPATQRWMRAVLDHSLVRDWLSEADRLPHIWFDEYLVPDESWVGEFAAAATGTPNNG